MSELESHSFSGVQMNVFESVGGTQSTSYNPNEFSGPPPAAAQSSGGKPQLNVPPNVKVPNEVMKFLQPVDTKKPAPSETNPKLDTTYRPIETHPPPTAATHPAQYQVPQNKQMYQQQELHQAQDKMSNIKQLKQLATEPDQRETEAFAQQLSKMMGGNLQQKDVPLNTQDYLFDPSIQANYIPKPNSTQVTQDDVIQQMMMEKPSQTADKMEYFYQQLQLPVLVALLFFFFQLPWSNKILAEYFPRLFKEDGTASIYVFLIKTSIFVSIFSAIYAVLQI